jgi:signal peptidase I
MTMSATLTTPELTPPIGFRKKMLRVFWSLLFPASAALLTLRYLIPSKFAAATGATQTVARFASQNPLVVLIVLFIAISETAHYWRSRFFGLPRLARRSWTRGRLATGVALVIALALFLRVFVAEVYRVTSASMLPDISVGDRLLVSKSAYGIRVPGTKLRLGAKLPKRGDVIVFMGDAQDGRGRVALVKRVIGLPGDKVQFLTGMAWVNGKQVPSCDAGTYQAFELGRGVKGHLAVEYLDNRAYLTVFDFSGKNTQPYNVPEGQVFVVGDDRDLSNDSRLWNNGHGGGVPVEDILGRVSRVLVGGRPDGRFDFSHVLAPVGLDLHMPGVDLTNARHWIRDCLKDPLPSEIPAPTR